MLLISIIFRQIWINFMTSKKQCWKSKMLIYWDQLEYTNVTTNNYKVLLIDCKLFKHSVTCSSIWQEQAIFMYNVY